MLKDTQYILKNDPCEKESLNAVKIPYVVHPGTFVILIIASLKREMRRGAQVPSDEKIIPRLEAFA